MQTRGAKSAVLLLAFTTVLMVCSPLAGGSNGSGAGDAPFVLTKQDAGTSVSLYGVAAPDSDHCWAVGQNGKIYYTSNAGLDWTEQSRDKISRYLYAVAANNNQTAWAAGAGGYIYKTEDGSTWDAKPKQPNDRYAVTSVGSQNVWVAGLGDYDSHHAFDYSTDGGDNWKGCGPITAEHLTYYGISVIKSGDNFVGWAVGKEGYAQYLNDSDPSKWKKNYFSTKDYDMYGVSVVDGDHAWAVGESGRILYWSPPAGGGDPTWTVQTAPSGVGNLRGVSAVSGDKAWAVSDNGSIIHTSNAGQTWNKQSVPGGVGALYAVSAVDSNNMWAVGSNGTIVHGHLLPYIAGCDPNSAIQGDENKPIDITGVNTYFQTGASTADFGGGGVDVTGTSAVSHTEARASIDVLTNAQVGGRNVTVTTESEVAQSQTEVFQVKEAPPPPQPKIDLCKPKVAQQWDELRVVINGENTQFTKGVSTADFGDGIKVENTHVVTDEYAIAKIKIDGNATVGPRGVNVYTEGEQTPQALNEGFTVNAEATPFISGCQPPQVVQGNEYSLTVSGRNTHFQQGLSEGTFTGQGIEVQATNVTNNGVAIVDIVVVADADLGPRDVNVVTPGLEYPNALPGGLVVVEPHIQSLSPTDAVQGHVINMQILGEGTHFADGLSETVISGEGVKAQGTNVSDSEHATAANVKIDDDAAPGSRDVNVVTGGETPVPLEGGLTVHAKPTEPPVLSDVSPGSGTVGTVVALTGKNFGATRGSSKVTFDGADADTFLSWSDYKIECRVPMRALTGNVTVLTPWGNSNTLKFAVEDFEFDFAEGTCRSDFDAYFCIQNPERDEADVKITYMLGDGTTREQAFTVPASSRYTVKVSDFLGVGDDTAHDFSAAVECTNELAVIAERPMYFDYQGYSSLNWTGGDDVVGEHDPSTTYYFAEGTCRPDFDPYLTIQNPGSDTANVKITYMLGNGVTMEQDMALAPHSRSTVRVEDFLGVGDDAAHDFSAKVACTNKKEIIAERPMYFNYNGVWTGGHDVIGAVSPAEKFYFAEGTCRPGFDTYICIQNPGDLAAEVKLTYMLGDGTNRVDQVRVDPHSRSTVKVSDFLGVGDDVSHDFSSLVESTNNVEIVAERPMYFDYQGSSSLNWTGGHDVVGTPAPSNSFYFAEGTCRPDFDPYLCIQNPQLAHAEVAITYMLGDGTTREQNVNVAAISRVTVKVADFLGVGDDVSHDFSAAVECTNGLGIIVERPMYFNYSGAWTGGSDVIGFTD